MKALPRECRTLHEARPSNRPHFEFLDNVTITARLTRSRTGSKWRSHSSNEWVPVPYLRPVSGVVIGWRRLTNGAAGETPTGAWSYTSHETITALLVVFDGTKNPVYVLPEHARITTYPLRAVQGGVK